MSRIFVTNNLHGRLDEFKYLLNYVKFNFSTDKLVILGNYLNKGPSQLEMMDYLIELSKVSNNIYILYGKTEQRYIDAFVNNDFKSEQKITKEKNVFYEYLDNPKLRNKHIQFLMSLQDKIILDEKYFFTSEKEMLEGYICLYPSNDELDEDIIIDNDTIGVLFRKHVGLIEITERKCFRI